MILSYNKEFDAIVQFLRTQNGVSVFVVDPEVTFVGDVRLELAVEDDKLALLRRVQDHSNLVFDIKKTQGYQLPRWPRKRNYVRIELQSHWRELRGIFVEFLCDLEQGFNKFKLREAA